MNEISVEVILFGVLILVMALDLIIKGRKNKSGLDSSFKKIESVSNAKGINEDTEGKSLFSLKEYLVERPKNIGLYLMSVFILKVLIHYIAYPVSYIKKIPNPLYGSRARIRGGVASKYKNLELDYPFSFYIENLFSFDGSSPHIFMWIISIGLLSFVAWQLNSYIQKR
jgi:hypothetical protein